MIIVRKIGVGVLVALMLVACSKSDPAPAAAASAPAQAASAAQPTAVADLPTEVDYEKTAQAQITPANAGDKLTEIEKQLNQ